MSIYVSAPRAVAAGEPADERELLTAALRPDGDAYARLVGPYRAGLHAHCYRMLGSVTDAEDALQETLLRAWRGLPRFEGRSSLRTWLYKIATNVCLRAAERQPKRVLPVDYAPEADTRDGLADPVDEAVWLQPYPDERLGLPGGPAGPDARYEQRESVELAFIAALAHLPARQRAVLILRDVLGFSARETAEVLETTPVSVDSALQRAHRRVDQGLPERSQQATLRSLGDRALSEVVGRFVTAWERNDVDALVAMLAQDARMAMPPLPTWYRGREQIGAFLAARVLAYPRRWHLIPARVNGQLAFAAYLRDEKAPAFVPDAVMVAGLHGRQIAEITAFRTPDTLASLGLPAVVPAGRRVPHPAFGATRWLL